MTDLSLCLNKVEKILKGSLDLIPSPSLSVKIQIMGGKVSLRFKGKTLLGVVNKLLKTKSWHQPVMFCLITSSKLSEKSFEFSLKVKVMGSNPCYLLKSCLLYLLLCNTQWKLEAGKYFWKIDKQLQDIYFSLI